MWNPFKTFALVFVALAVAPALWAQETCPAIVEQALDAVDQFCNATGRNQACYGHFAVEAVPQPDVTTLDFSDQGDIADVTTIRTLRLQPMNTAAAEWGVALMRLQANLPGSLPGQNVTFLLFGDVEISSAVPEDDPSGDLTPMQAFTLRTGVGDSQCAEAPESGLVVQTPEGAGEVIFSINGVEVGMGSTVVFRAEADGEMVVSTIEGLAVLEVEDEVQPVLAGTRLRVPLDRTLRPFRRLVNPPEPYELRRLEGIPLRLLQRRIEIARPLTQQQVNRAMQRLLSGQPICGVEGLPNCDRIPRTLLARAMKASRASMENRLGCAFRRGANETPLAPDDSRPYCDQQPPESLPCVFVPGPDDPPLPERETRPLCPQLPENMTLRGLRRDNRIQPRGGG
ncbi:MAG: hypothetical protein K8J31_29040 [Anaerolineae bacterium]|nr:hypothetical protein [Anaerolineae bacterium]